MTEEQRDQETSIGELLDAAARDYEPDGERLRALVASRIAESEDARGLPRIGRLAGGRGGTLRNRALRTWLERAFSAGAGIAAVAAAVAIAVGVTATLAVTSGGPAAGGPTENGGGTGPAGGPGKSSTGLRVPTGTPEPQRSSAPPAAPDAYAATERVDQASNPDWAQLDVVFAAKKPVTALEITIRVAGCTGLGSTGFFDTGASGAFVSSESAGPDGSISYVFRLAAGVTLAPGTVEFAAQFNHGPAGWHPAGDTYRISAGTAGAPAPQVTSGGY